MKRYSLMQWLATTVACLGMTLPSGAFAAHPAQSSILDVTLHQDGALIGQIVGAQGAPVRGEAVAIQQNGVEVARCATDGSGYFYATGLTGGVYTVTSSRTQAVCRAWAPGTAPPIAGKGVLMVQNDLVVNGNRSTCCNPCATASCGGCGSCGDCGCGSCGGCCGGALGGIGSGGLLAAFSNPWLATAVVATAIAVPIAVSHDDNDVGS